MDFLLVFGLDQGRETRIGTRNPTDYFLNDFLRIPRFLSYFFIISLSWEQGKIGNEKSRETGEKRKTGKRKKQEKMAIAVNEK